MLISFLLSLIVGCEGHCALANPFPMPLPSSKELWEAKTAAEWEERYESSLSRTRELPFRFETIGDLANANKHRETGSVFTMNALDDWYAGLDSLGFMVSSVISES